MTEGDRLTVDIEPRPDGVCLRVSGDLDLATVETLLARAAEQLHGPAASFTVDLAGVPFCDSTGMSALIAVRKRCDEAGWRLRLVNLTPTVHRVLVEMAGLGDFLHVEADLEAGDDLKP